MASHGVTDSHVTVWSMHAHSDVTSCLALKRAWLHAGFPVDAISGAIRPFPRRTSEWEAPQSRETQTKNWEPAKAMQWSMFVCVSLIKNVELAGCCCNMLHHDRTGNIRVSMAATCTELLPDEIKHRPAHGCVGRCWRRLRPSDRLVCINWCCGPTTLTHTAEVQ